MRGNAAYKNDEQFPILVTKPQFQLSICRSPNPVHQDLVCHRCGHARFAAEGEARCPVDNTWMILRKEHLNAPQDPYLGTELGGRYPILGSVSWGRMGTVYRSRKAMVDQPVLVKIARLDGSHGDELRAERHRQQFLKEARRLAGVNHDSVVTLHDFGTDGPDRSCFMVVELVQGRPLASSLHELKSRRLVEICIELLEALAAAHERGVVHSDVTPQNIMLTGSNRLKLIGFRLSRSTQASSFQNTEGIAGTPAYMAPEQAAGRPIDHRADLYAVGAILFEGLTGTPPFGDDQTLTALLRVINDPVPSLNVPGIPCELASIISRALAKAPSSRFSDAVTMADALSAIVWEEPKINLGKHRLLPAVLTAGVLASLAYLLLGANPMTLPSPPNEPAVQMAKIPDESTPSPEARRSAVRRDRVAGKGLVHLEPAPLTRH